MKLYMVLGKVHGRPRMQVLVRAENVRRAIDVIKADATKNWQRALMRDTNEEWEVHELCDVAGERKLIEFIEMLPTGQVPPGSA